jgi:multiple sugar transport system permease protein
MAGLATGQTSSSGRLPGRGSSTSPAGVAPGTVRSPTAVRPLTAYLFLIPYLALFVLFVLAPILYGLWISLHDWDFLLPGKPFVGLQNYVDLFTPGSTTAGPFWAGMRATAIFTVLSVPLLVVLPLLIAVPLARKFPGRNFFRAVVFAPFVLGVAVVGILWRYLLDPNVGVLASILDRVGIDSPPWLTDTPWVWGALLIPTLWWTLGYNMVIYLAGLQDISRELYEAAEMDGASRRQQFFAVTLPGLRPVTVFVITITILASANLFGQSFLITQGQPGRETRSAIMQIAEEGLGRFNMGSAAAMSTILTLSLVLVSVASLYLLRDRDAK